MPAPAARIAPRLLLTELANAGLTSMLVKKLYDTPNPRNGRKRVPGSRKWYCTIAAGLHCRALVMIGFSDGSPRLWRPSAPAGPGGISSP
ncbi:hypothetical protein D3C72_2162690 [compost metagenome]